MVPYDEEFTRLKTGDETRKIARSLYLKASELTKPGSGRGLGLGQSALSAVCAFLASKRLGNGEVTRDQACAVACVDPKTFDSTLAIVESVLRPSHASPRLKRTNITYQSLLKQYVAREDAFVPMVEVEELLKGCEALVDGSPIDVESSLMQCAIFYWVCTAVLRVSVPDATHLRQMLKVSPKTWSAAQRVLEKHCSHVMDDLIRKAETALSARASRTQMRTAGKEKIQDLKGLAGKLSCSQDGLPVGLVAFDNTPRASIGVSGTFVACSAISPTSHPRAVVRARVHVPSNSLSTQDTQEDSPTVGLVAFDNTPATSAGASDTSPPISPSHSSRGSVIRTRRHGPHLATTRRLCYSVQEEDVPRRRRRNLCATFLHPGVYGWKPAAQTAKKLERARNWESLMISKYGDPWDAW